MPLILSENFKCERGAFCFFSLVLHFKKVPCEVVWGHGIIPVSRTDPTFFFSMWDLTSPTRD